MKQTFYCERCVCSHNRRTTLLTCQIKTRKESKRTLSPTDSSAHSDPKIHETTAVEK
jgi:hypothetical protein